MSREIKYIGMDVHKEAIAIAVLNGTWKRVLETIVATKASSILEFIQGVRGELHVTWEEGTWAEWLYDLLGPQMEHVLDCDPCRDACCYLHHWRTRRPTNTCSAIHGRMSS